MILFLNIFTLLFISPTTKKPVYFVATNETVLHSRIITSKIDRVNKKVLAYDTMTVYTLPCKDGINSIQLASVKREKQIKPMSFFQKLKPKDCTWISGHIKEIVSSNQAFPLIGPIYIIEMNRASKEVTLTQVVFDIAQEEKMKDW